MISCNVGVRCCSSSSLPIALKKAKYHRQLESAVDVVHKACRLCLHVKKSSSSNRIVEKNDQTPVTVADFAVQALISSELGRLFPSIPLVAEEDSALLRSNAALAHNVVDLVNHILPLTHHHVLDAIDRGGAGRASSSSSSSTYWVLDPIDGTRGFLKGIHALYVVGLALVIDGEISVGVMGCPNWQADNINYPRDEDQEERSGLPGPGIVMVAHIGCGTWTKRLSDMQGNIAGAPIGWDRCYVDNPCFAHEARFCFPESITWESLPLSNYLSTTTNADKIGDKEVLILPTCCGSLCKYLMVASGRASVFILRSKAETLIKVWDHAVGVICVVEAGGQVTDWQGSQLDLGADKVERRLLFPPGGVLVTNGQGNLHHQILGMLSDNITSSS